MKHVRYQKGESFESFTDMTGREFVLYNFINPDGKEFSCTARSIGLARNKRNLWKKMGFVEMSRMTDQLLLLKEEKCLI